MMWYKVKLSDGRVDVSIVMPGITEIWSCQKFGMYYDFVQLKLAIWWPE